MTDSENHLLTELRAGMGRQVLLWRKNFPGGPCIYQLEDVFQSRDPQRFGRWVAVVSTGKLYAIDILAEIERIEFI